MPGSDNGIKDIQPSLDELISLKKAAKLSGLSQGHLSHLKQRKRLVKACFLTKTCHLIEHKLAQPATIQTVHLLTVG